MYEYAEMFVIVMDEICQCPRILEVVTLHFMISSVTLKNTPKIANVF